MTDSVKLFTYFASRLPPCHLFYLTFSCCCFVLPFTVFSLFFFQNKKKDSLFSFTAPNPACFLFCNWLHFVSFVFFGVFFFSSLACITKGRTTNKKKKRSLFFSRAFVLYRGLAPRMTLYTDVITRENTSRAETR